MELIAYWPWWLLLVLIPWCAVYRYSLVDAPRWKRLSSFLLRVAALVLLIVALCRPFAFRPTTAMHVVFLVDVSQSVDVAAARNAVEQVREAIGELRPGDTWSLLAVAEGTRMFEGPQPLGDWIDRWESEGADDRFRSATQLGAAVLQARSLFPTGCVKQVILFTDGHDTTGELPDALRRAAREGISVRWQRLSPLGQPEAAIASIAPSTTQAFLGEVVRLTIEARSNRLIHGRLRIIHRGVAVQEQPVALQPGVPNRCYFDVDMVTPGASQWTAELIPDVDHFAINNQMSCTLTVRGQPRVLFLHRQEAELRPIVRALQEQDFSIEVRGRFGVPESLEELLSFDAVVLADLPATAMTQRQMEMFRQYVVDFGGGLIMLGSENSFGLGGYHRTPVEEVLPLVSRYEKEQEKPSLAMVLVIDKSGSMDGLPILLAREAAKAAVELLGPRDRVAVVGFDSQPQMVSDMRLAMESDAIVAAINTLEAGGGTNLFPAMLAARDMLENTPAKIRHMICLSDGHTEPADHEGLVDEMVANGITVSTVALGDADRPLLERIAELGRGRYYETEDPENVPQIFTSETMHASRSAIKEDLYATIPVADHPVLTGFRQMELPFTLGYVMTQAKPTAQLLLVADSGDPLLAIGRFGLGVGLAWSSDWSERWGGEWLAWNDGGRFWAQVLRGTIRPRSAEGVHITSHVRDGHWHLDIRRRDTAGMPQSRVEWELGALDGRGQIRTIGVQEVGLGRYRASVPLEDQNQVSLRLRDRAVDQFQVLHYHCPWPAEYRLDQSLPEEIQSLATFQANAIRHGVVPHSTRLPIAHLFYFAAVTLLLLSTLLRRL